MVAISLYRGNMHRVAPEVPRRWLMPKPKITIKEFRTLLLRRSTALSHLPSTSSSSPNPNLPQPPPPPPPPPPPLIQNPNLETDIPPQQISPEKGNNKLANGDDQEKRKKEVEEKLKILNEKKHNLVQALKQILNAEEELKRRSCLQAGKPPLPSQLDASNDSGSMTRHATPRTGSEANITVDMEGGEGDDALNHNPQSRLLPHLNNTSPSAESALRRAPYFHPNAASHPSRAAIVAAGSPSRFAPSGNQGQPSNLPTVSVSGTNYVASSPSPAASGGTSGFRDARQPSPWN